MDEVKQCTKCNEANPLDDFYPNSGGRNGRHSQCKACHTAHYHENIEARRAWSKKYRKENRTLLLQRGRTHYYANREALLKEKKEHRKANREELRVGHMDRYYKDPYAFSLRASAKRYAITVEQVKAIRGQNCNICKIPASELTKRQSYLDHDHNVPGPLSLRGHLCGRCNSALGYHEKGKAFGRNKNPEWQAAAEHYLVDYEQRLSEL